MAKKSGAPASSNGAASVLSTLKSVYEFMTQNDLEALEVDEKGTRIKLVRRRTVSHVPVPVPLMTPTGGGLPYQAPPAIASAPGAAAPPPAPEGVAIKAPMMGIFYRAPSPSSPPFVKEGETVKPGQVLCMIEAMKVFNEIKAEYACTIVRVLLENGKPVKSGQDIFIVKR